MTTRSKLVATTAVLALLAAGLTAVHSAFTSTTRNDANTFEAGTMSLTDDDQGKVLFDLRGLHPKSPKESRCVTVKYDATGDISPRVRLYGETNGELAPYLWLKVVRGSFPGGVPTDGSCTGFAPATDDYYGKGRGVLFSDQLSKYPQSWDEGVTDAKLFWNDGDEATYQLQVWLSDGDAAQGLSATQAFVWQAVA